MSRTRANELLYVRRRVRKGGGTEEVEEAVAPPKFQQGAVHFLRGCILGSKLGHFPYF